MSTCSKTLSRTKRDRVTFENFAKAIEAFEATLITPAAPFDQYLGGNTHALNDQEKSGLALFMEKGCSTCHNGINVGGQAYFPFGAMKKPDPRVLPDADGAGSRSPRRPPTNMSSARRRCGTSPCEPLTSIRVRFGI
ncbi:cytochrome c peroxidase [Bradyrhizobium sp. WSM1417]|uniref:cytochrome c peroxidase n=1 Tax=Bradyrhizobium sp. WSM1417 TaxID=754500 RepID=UPI00352876DB